MTYLKEGDLSSVKAFSGVRSASTNLEDFVVKFNTGLIKEMASLDMGELSREDLLTQVLVVIGPPLSGKTRVLKIINDEMTRNTRRALSGREKIRSKALNWEEDGEDVARRAGLITTPQNEPYTESELQAANDQIERTTRLAIGKNEALTLELPASAAVQVSSQWLDVGRKLGSDLLFHLGTRTGGFERTRPYHARYIALLGGPLLTYLMGKFRDEYCNANTLIEAQEVAYLFGQPIPLSEAEWHHTMNGASEKQALKIWEVQDQVAVELGRRNLVRIKPPSSGISLSSLLEIESAFYKTNLRSALVPHPSLRHYAAAKVVEYLFENNLQKDASEFFIGYNDPSWEALGIPDIDKLLKHIEEKGKERFR